MFVGTLSGKDLRAIAMNAVEHLKATQPEMSARERADKAIDIAIKAAVEREEARRQQR